MATATLKAKLTMDDTPYQRVLRKSVVAAKKAGAQIKGALGKGLTFGAGAAGIGAAIGGAALVRGIKVAYDMGGALSDLSARTGVAAEALLVMQRAMADNGVEAGQAGAIINKMQKSIGDAVNGSKPLVEEFARLNLNLSELKRLSPDRQMEAIGAAINDIPDAAGRAASAMAIFGRSGGQLLTMFADGNAMNGARQTLGSMATILAENAATFDTISDRLSRVGVKFDGFLVGVASKFAPTMLALTEAFEKTDFAQQGERFGAAMQGVADVLFSVWKDPESILQPFSDFLHAMWAKAANFMVASFIKGFKAVGGYMLEAVNRFRAANIAAFEEIMARIPGSGYDKTKTFAERQRAAERSGAGARLRNQAANLIGTKIDVKDIFGAESALRRGKAGLSRTRERGATIREKMTTPEMIGPNTPQGWQRRGAPIGPQLPPNWKANPFANFKTMGFGGSGLQSGGLTSGGLGSAYNQIRKGDAERRKAEAAKAKDATERTATAAETLVTITRNAWAN